MKWATKRTAICEWSKCQRRIYPQSSLCHVHQALVKHRAEVAKSAKAIEAVRKREQAKEVARIVKAGNRLNRALGNTVDVDLSALRQRVADANRPPTRRRPQRRLDLTPAEQGIRTALVSDPAVMVGDAGITVTITYRWFVDDSLHIGNGDSPAEALDVLARKVADHIATMMKVAS